MKYIILILISLFISISLISQDGWRDNEMEVKIFFDKQSEIQSFSKYRFSCDFYPGYAIAFLTPEELEIIEKLGVNYQIRIENLNNYYRNFWDNKASYHTYQEIIDLMDSLAASFPDICSKKIYGQSVGGREMSALKISDNVLQDEAEAEIAFNGSIHGDEISGAENLVRFARHLCTNYGINTEITELIDKREIWIFCLANPDGRVSLSRYNANNVDLNRDWGYMWDAWGNSSGPYSQPETKILRDFVLEHRFVMQISYHNGAEAMLYPWYYRADQCPDHNHITFLSQVYADSSGYNNLSVIQGYSYGPTNGSSAEMDYGSSGVFGLAMEISNNKQPPPSLLMHYYNINLSSMLEMVRFAGYGLQGFVYDSVSGDPVQAAIFVDNQYPVYTDSALGDYHKFLLAGNYSLKIKANGYQSKTIDNVIISNEDSSRLDIMLTPLDSSSQHAYRLISCQVPGNNFEDEGDTRKCLGQPDNEYYSLGKGGWIIADMQTPILNNPGNDIKVIEGSGNQESYSIYAGSSIDGPYIFMGNGTGTEEFELAAAGLNQARYFKILDDGDGVALADNAGFDLDALSSLSEITGVYINLFDYSISDSAGNNNSWIDPGESIQLDVEIGNTGAEESLNTTGTLTSASPYVNITQNTYYFGNIEPGQFDTGEFIFDVDPGVPSGELLSFILLIEANNGNYSTTFELEFFAGKKPMLIIDLDGNVNSGPELQLAAEALGVNPDYNTTFPDRLDIYETVFLCLGIFDENHSLTGSEGSKLSNYLAQEGKLYMEGGDTWFYDPQTSVHEKFNINGTADGYGDLDILTGTSISFVQNYIYNYSGDNAYIDRIIPADNNSFELFTNNNPSYCAAVAYDQGTYKTMGCSFEFGGLDDGQNTKTDLLQEILEFFGGVLTNTEKNNQKNTEINIYPNPFRKSLNFEIQNISGNYVKIYIFDIHGIIVYFDRFMSNTRLTKFSWKLPGGINPNQSGIYFYKIITDGYIHSGKAIYSK